MSIIESFRDWISHKQPALSTLDGVSVVTMGETGDLSPPFLGIMETGSDEHETEGVIMHGVIDYQVTCELHTVPADSDQSGTPTDDAAAMRRDFYGIIADRDAIDWISERNEWRVFDIRAVGPTSDASEGRLIARWNLQITACPL